MPVPWQQDLLDARRAGPGCGTKNRIPAENGITLAQLRSTMALLKQLCKTHLLRHTSDFSRRTGEYGSNLKWTTINMHNINQEMIKKLIPENNSCSWVEIISRIAQKPKIFVSHNWSEPFRDFMTAIELYKSSAGVGLHDTLFICTFANDQWHVDLGETLQDSPFFLALSGAKQVVLMLDKMGSALSRIWCVYEMKTTLDQGTPLTIATPLGIMGSKCESASSTSSSQVAEVLRSVDVSRAQASNPVDRRQIINSIARVHEEQGLRKDTAGRKSLVDEEEVTNAGVVDYKYEFDLIQSTHNNFDSINDYIHQYADQSAPENEQGCRVEDPARRALTLAQLRVMSRRAESYFFHKDRQDWREANRIKAWGDLNHFHLTGSFFKEFNAKRGHSSYMECVAEGPQLPEYLITNAFTSSIKDLLASLEWFAEARELPSSAAFWFLPAAMMKEEVDQWMTTKCCPPSFCALDYYMGQVVIMDKGGGIITRALPCYEIHGILSSKKLMDLACPEGVIATTRPFSEGWEFGSFDHSLALAILDYDVAKIQGRVEHGQDPAEMTKCAIVGMEYRAGDRAPESHPKYAQFNNRLRSKVFGPALRGVATQAALKQGSIDTLRKILNMQGRASLTNIALRGLLGEAAVHLAAASGHVEAVELLLQNQAHPNAEDIDGETPLHYACMTGQVETMRVLLRYGANPHQESFFMETPVNVAELNAAAFLEVDTTEVRKLIDSPNSITRSSASYIPPQEAYAEEVIRAFRQSDAQNTGTIRQETLCNILISLDPNFPYEKIKGMLQSMDICSSDTVNYNDFVTTLFSAPAR